MIRALHLLGSCWSVRRSIEKRELTSNPENPYLLLTDTSPVQFSLGFPPTPPPHTHKYTHIYRAGFLPILQQKLSFYESFCHLTKLTFYVILFAFVWITRKRPFFDTGFYFLLLITKSCQCVHLYHIKHTFV